MKLKGSTMMRLNLTKLMQEKEFSYETRSAIHHHIAKLKMEQGNKMAKELLEKINLGATEAEIRKIVQVKYKVTIAG